VSTEESGELTADLLAQAAEAVITSQYANVNLLIRALRVRYATAAALMDQLRQHGVVGDATRDVHFPPEQATQIAERIRAGEPATG